MNAVADALVGKLEAVCVGLPRTVPYGPETVSTAIFKSAVAGPVELSFLNLAGDRQADRRVHGGVNKAVYAYPAEHYAVWAAELGRTDFVPGQFGENFTIRGADESAVALGDVFRVGTALVQVAQPRMPCFKFAIRMNDKSAPKRLVRSGRTGYYLKVVEEGIVEAGADFTRIDRAADPITVRDFWHLVYFEPDNVAGAVRALRIPTLGPEWAHLLQPRVFGGR